MTNLMPSGAVQTFTAADNTTISATDFAIPTNQGTGGGATVQSNQCRIRTGTTSGNRTSIRLNIATRADIEIDFVWTVGATGFPQFAAAWLRSVTAMDTQQGYYLMLYPSDMVFGSATAYSGTDLITYTHGFTTGQVVHTRIAIFGTRFRARTWLQSNAEPTSTWQIDTTNSTYTTGFTGVTTASSSAGSKDFIIDTFNATDTITPSQATLPATAAILPTGALVKSVAKKYAGSITPAGTLAIQRTVPKTFSGSITPSGIYKKTLAKTLTGAITPAGTYRKTLAKTFTGAITPAATMVRVWSKRFVGTITPAGATNMLPLGRVFGRPGIAVMNLIQKSTVSIRHRRG